MLWMVLDREEDGDLYLAVRGVVIRTNARHHGQVRSAQLLAIFLLIILQEVALYFHKAILSYCVEGLREIVVSTIHGSERRYLEALVFVMRFLHQPSTDMDILAALLAKRFLILF